MGRLFNKDGEGSVEIHQITGIFHASNNYSVISTEVDDAIRAVSALIGTAVMDKAMTLYEAGNDQTGLVAAVQQPVAVLAVSRYTRNNLVSHGDHGSRLPADENEKIPFEWMIDRDESAQQERYFRSLDALFGFLEKSELPEWMESEARKTCKISIVDNIREFERVYPVDGSYYVYYMLQNLVIEVHPTLRRMLGDDLWVKVLARDSSEKAVSLRPFCQRYAVLSAVVAAARRWSLEVFPLSVARRFAPSYQGNRETRVATRDEIEAYIAGLKEQLEETRSEIAQELADGRNPWDGFDPMPEGSRRNKFFSAQ